MINVHVYPEIAVMDQDVGDVFVISIVSPGREHPKIIGTNVHQFHFHDVTQVYEYDDGRLILPMSEIIASQIAEVAIKNRHKHNWIIHCEAGISRSPGVAIGLAKYIQMNPGVKRLKKLYPCYNKHVKNMIEIAVWDRIKEEG